MTLEEAGQTHWRDLESLGQKATAESSRSWLVRLFEFCRDRGVCEVEGLEPGILASFRQHVTWTPGPSGVLYSQSTLFQCLRMVRLFCRWLKEQELVMTDFAQGWCLRRPPEPNRRIPSVEEISRLLLVPDAGTLVGIRNRAILELLYGTGIRSNECYAADLDSLDFEAARMHIRGKGKRDRMVPLGGHLRQCLRRYLEIREKLGPKPEENALFLSSKGGDRLSLVSLGVLVRLSAKAAGLGGFGPHTLRHAFATHLLENGADVAYIGALLGHENLASTEIYTQVSPLELKREHRRTHPRAQKPQ